MPACSKYSMLCGSRLSPMLKHGNISRSSINTCRPCRHSSPAATAPAGPAPIIKTSTNSGDRSITDNVWGIWPTDYTTSRQLLLAKKRHDQANRNDAQCHGQSECLQRRGFAQSEQTERQHRAQCRETHSKPCSAIFSPALFLKKNPIIDADAEEQHERQYVE